jgi:hypothetical protein
MQRRIVYLGTVLVIALLIGAILVIGLQGRL